MQNKLEQTEINVFLGYINQGVEAWVKAGKWLVQMRDRDSDVYNKILRSCPGISVDTLLVFEKIGRRKLNPRLLLDNSPGSKRLMSLPYDLQVSCESADLEVLTGWSNGRPVVQKKKLRDLSASEAYRVFSTSWFRTPKEQEDFLPKPSSNPRDFHKSEDCKSSFTTCGFYKIVLDNQGQPVLRKTDAPKGLSPELTITVTGDTRIGLESETFGVGLRSETFEVVMPASAREEMNRDEPPENQEKERSANESFLDRIEDCQRQIDQKEEAIAALDPKSPVVKRLLKDIKSLRDKIVKYELLTQ
jgi:hypothetical protein